MIKIFNSLQSKLSIFFITLLSTTLILSTIIIYTQFKKSLVENMDETLYSAALETENLISENDGDFSKTQIGEIIRGFIISKLFIQVYKLSSDPKIVARSLYSSHTVENMSSLIDVWSRLPETERLSNVFIKFDKKFQSKHPMRVLFFPVKQKKKLEYLICIATSLKRISKSMSELKRILILLIPLLIIMMGVLGVYVLYHAFSPLKLLSDTIQKTSLDTITQRIEVKEYKNEIGTLITTFNDMLSRLNRSIVQMQHFSGNVSHELKTPLTVIRGEIEITLRKKRDDFIYIRTLEKILDESKRLENLIVKLLLLSQLAYKKDIKSTFSTIDLNKIILESYEKVLTKANEKKIALIISNMNSVEVAGDSKLLFHLIYNVLDNAIKYTPSGGKVKMSLVDQDSQVTFTVEDNGIGIPENDLGQVFNHFYKAENNESDQNDGSGLGLAIVRWIADIHGIDIDIHSKKGKGTCICFNFSKTLP